MSKMGSTHNIVILGAGWGGISVAHQLLRHVLPALSAASKVAYKVTMVAPTAYFYFKVGAPRGLVAPDLVPTDNLLIKLADGFKEYPASAFQLVQGAAVAIEPSTTTVIVKPTSDDAINSEKTINISYDSLIIATGVHQASPIWAQRGTDSSTRAALKDIHDLLPRAKSILVAGGGPAGTETAGELGSAYGKSKDITILSGSDRLLTNLTPPRGHDAEARLKKLGVKTINNVRVVSASDLGGKTQLTLDDGTSRTVDVYISAVGEKPNTDYVPAEWKNEKGYVKSDPATLRVIDVPHVYVLGSAGSYSKGGIMDIMFATKPLAETIRVDLFSILPSSAQAALEPSKPSFPFSLFRSAPPPASEHHLPYKPMTSELGIVPIGRKQGVGAAFGWKIPSFFVWMIKSRTFMVEKAPGFVAGADYK